MTASAMPHRRIRCTVGDSSSTTKDFAEEDVDDVDGDDDYPCDLPMRSLLTCHVESMTNVSSLSIDCSDHDPAARRASNIQERFAAPARSDRKLPNLPGRKKSLQRLSVSEHIPTKRGKDALRNSLPPRIPSRQDTADRKSVFTSSGTEDDGGDADAGSNRHVRPTLHRVSGGINVLSCRSSH